MKFISKKLLAAALAALMLLPLASCATTSDDALSETTAVQSQDEADTREPNFVTDRPNNLNFDQTEVTFLYVKKDGRGDEMPCEKLGLGTISDAIYERNLAVETQLGVKLGFVGVDDDGAASSDVRNLVQAGDSSLEIFTVGTYHSLSLAIEGLYLDLNQVEYVDTSKHYWSQEFNEIATFTSENLQFLATSPAALSLFRLTYLTIYNRELFTDRGLPDLYSVVEKGEWTLDYQYRLVSDEYVDKDGDGKPGEGDFYGFITGDVVSVDPYCVSSGIRFLSRDENGDWIATENIQDAVIDMSEKVSLLYNARGTYVFSGTEHDDIGKYSIIEKFAKEEGLMATTQFLSMERRIDALADIGYGIVPMPKLNADQKQYQTYVQDQVTSFGISAAVGTEARREVLGAVMESIAYNSYLIVRPAYYDSTLSLRFMQDPQSGEILDLMFDTISFDRMFLAFSVDVRGTMRNRLPKAAPALASQLKAWSKGITNALNKERKSLDKLLKG